MTNKDKIKAMDSTELTNLLSTTSCNCCIYLGKDCTGKSCTSGINEWLESECEENLSIDNKPEVDLQKAIQDVCKKCKEKHPNDWYTMADEASKKIDQLIYSTESDNKVKEACDNVNHPAHYTFGNIEVIDFIEDKKLGFNLGNTVKYISRAGRKDPARTVEDLRKAEWYLKRQIERLERELGGQNNS